MSEKVLYENTTSKTYIAVLKYFNFERIQELVALLQQLFYIEYFTLQQDEKQHLVKQIRSMLEQDLEIYCQDFVRKDEILLQFEEYLPKIQKLVVSDIEAAYKGDPAANSPQEIIAAYPGPFAIMIQRVAHKLYQLNVPILPRIMTEYAHSKTGIDIHPGASIDEEFFIDHGTGVVIGETAVIGKCVKVYQGVTLGALSVNGGQKLKHVQRHPIVEDDVTIYAGATILGGNTRIGRGSIIGGNTWITESIPKYSKVSQNATDLQIKKILEKD